MVWNSIRSRAAVPVVCAAATVLLAACQSTSQDEPDAELALPGEVTGFGFAMPDLEAGASLLVGSIPLCLKSVDDELDGTRRTLRVPFTLTLCPAGNVEHVCTPA